MIDEKEHCGWRVNAEKARGTERELQVLLRPCLKKGFHVSNPFRVGVCFNNRRINADFAHKQNSNFYSFSIVSRFTTSIEIASAFCSILPKFSSVCPQSFAAFPTAYTCFPNSHPRHYFRLLPLTVSVHRRRRLKFEPGTIPGWDLPLKILLLMELAMMQQAAIHPQI